MTFGEILAERAAERPQATAFTFLGDDGDVSVTYAQLDRRSRAIGTAIREASAAAERVLLLYPPGLDYVAALFGCFHAGVVAVPADPPNPLRLNQSLPRLLAIARDADPALVLTTAAFEGVLRSHGLRPLATDVMPEDADGASVAVAPDALALIQYTSGSTAAPRGVRISHANLRANSDFIRGAFGTSERSVAMVWLPPYHDMGLVGGLLQPVFVGFPCVLMSPLEFLRRPLRWLRAVSDNAATHSGGPNFAYDLCVRHVTLEQAAELDLSAWEVAFNGAEAVRPATLDAFAERFAPAGFRREALHPCYGLAEATLMATSGERLRAPHVCGGLASCGRPDRGHRLEIVDPIAGEPLPEGCVGEIWLAGPSVAGGYWRRPAETANTFGAALAGTGERFLRTGDLGLVRDGELFVTGRIKDLLIVGGRNHHATDVELACEQAASILRRGCGAAFTFERDGRERIAVVYEISAAPAYDADAVIRTMRGAVARATGARAEAIVLVRPQTIPKTSSGKVQRSRCRELFLKRRLDVVVQWSLDPGSPG